MRKTLIILIFTLILMPINIYSEELPFTNYIVKDMNSNRIFYQKASNIKKLPASTTKIMTAIVAIENSNLTDIVQVGEEILTMDGSNIYLEVGENILMQDLLYGLLLRSGNDASMTIAKHVSGNIENFVTLMNEKARELKLTNTIFNNPSGLDDFEKNYTTVEDLTSIYSYAYQNETFREIINTKEYKTESDKKSYYFKNRTKYVTMYDKSTGGKTGYTKDAGRVLVTSASNNDLNLVMATIGTEYGYQSHINTYEEIFKKYKTYKILDKKNIKIKAHNEEKAYIKNSFSYPLTKEEINKIEKKITLNKKNKGNIGEIQIYLDNELIHIEKIYIKETKKSIIKKLFEKLT